MTRTARRAVRRAALVALVGLVAVSALVCGPLGGAASAEEERRSGWYTLVDEAGRVLLRTGLVVTAGDRFVDAADREFTVNRVVGSFAYCNLTSRPSVTSRVMARLGRAAEVAGGVAARAARGAMKATVAAFGELAQRVGSPALAVERVAAPDGTAPRQAPATPQRLSLTAKRPLIGLYHTHSDESYVPTDGTESTEGRGGIFKVGDAMTRALEAAGFRVVHSRQPHDPHDAAAYDRSRGTARQLLQKGPVALFDVHRDTAPPEAYQARVAGQSVDQILIVLGRENPSIAANEAFARRVKATMDRRYPGLVRGLFYGLGKYNQDLTPHALLLEVGSHYTPRTDAERGVSLFARALPQVVGPQAKAPTAPGAVARGLAAESRRAASAVGWVLFVVVVGAAVFLAISTEGGREAMERLRRFWRQEVGVGGGRRRGGRGGRGGPGDRGGDDGGGAGP